MPPPLENQLGVQHLDPGACRDEARDVGVVVEVLLLAPAVEIEVDTCPGAVPRHEDRPGVPHPEVIERRLDEVDRRTDELAGEPEFLAAHQHRHRLELCDGPRDRRQVAADLRQQPRTPDLLFRSEGHPGSGVWVTLLGHRPPASVRRLTAGEPVRGRTVDTPRGQQR